MRRRRFFLGTWNMKGFLNEDRQVQTLRQVLDRLQETYCGPIGYEVLLLPVFLYVICALHLLLDEPVQPSLLRLM